MVLLEPLEPRRLFAIPHFDHVVLVVEENTPFSDIIGSGDAPYLNALANGGALFTQSYSLTHPSQPNYLNLFSGSNQGVTTDDITTTQFTTPNLGADLLAARLSFVEYSESLPAVGSLVDQQGEYTRIHNPESNWQGTGPNQLPASANQPFDFPTDYTTLPTVAFVAPNPLDDMHDGSIAQADSWLQSNLGGYATWAPSHNSLLIVTCDEGGISGNNPIATIFYGANVVPGQYSQTINHLNVLRTIEDMYGLPYDGDVAAAATPITDVWLTPPAAPTGLAADAASTTQINLTWSQPASNQTGFTIQRSVDGTNFTNLASTAANVTGYSDTALSPGTTYLYRVLASNSAGNSPPSNTAHATTPITLDFSYLVLLARHYAGAGTFATGDLDADGTIAFDDLVLVARNYGRTVFPGSLSAALMADPSQTHGPAR